MQQRNEKLENQEKEIAFIICTNDEKYFKECVTYINELEIPTGYQIDIISVQEAESITLAYQTVMEQCSAKYKIYLHQDVFILDKKFLHKLLNIFQGDEKIGMIGMLGAKRIQMQEDWDFAWDEGSMAYFDGRVYEVKRGTSDKENAIDVKVIFGGVMATQYDVSWRSDVIGGWDFYEISHSLEMQRSGYKIVVPMQNQPWCYHDRPLSSLRRFDKEWKKLQEEYRDFVLPVISVEQFLQDRDQQLREEKLYTDYAKLVDKGAWQTLRNIRHAICNQGYKSFLLRQMMQWIELYALEKESKSGACTKWWYAGDWHIVEREYRRLRFIFLRSLSHREDVRIPELQKQIAEQEVSVDVIWKVMGMFGKVVEGWKSVLCAQKENPLVSVVTSAHNSGDVIGKTIDSVLKQTYSNIEFIVVDDASTDNTREIISSYEDTRIKRIYLKKNQHVCYAINMAMKEASGKYIAFIGHDDIWDEEKIEKQVLFLEEHPNFCACFTWVNVIEEHGDNINNGIGKNIFQLFCRDNEEQDAWLRKLFLKGNCLCAPSACVRKETIENVGYYRYGVLQLQDYELWLRLLQEGAFYIIQEKLTNYRRFLGSNRNLDSGTIEAQERIRNEMYWCRADFIRKMKPKDFVRVFQKDLLCDDISKEKQVNCEKAIFLWNTGNPYADEMFFELLEDGECREILDKIYQISLIDFYKLNQTQWFYHPSE